MKPLEKNERGEHVHGLEIRSSLVKIMKSLLIVLFLSASFMLYGQVEQNSIHNDNLILNHDFEQVRKDTINWSKGELLYPNWYTLKYGTPDCFNYQDTTRAVYDFKSMIGNPQPYSGYGYIGFVPIAWIDYFETIIGEFSKPLIEGKKYEISFYIRHAGDSVSFRIRKLEAVLSQLVFFTNPNFSPDYSGFIVNSKTKVKPDLSFTVGDVDSESWKYVSQIYHAKGGEKYISFGIFYNKWLFDNIGKHGRIVPKGTDKSEIDFMNPIFMDKEKFYKRHDKVLFKGPNSEKLLKHENAPAYYFLDNICVKEINK